MKREKLPTKKELISMDYLLRQTIQFAECNEEEGLDFVMNFMDFLEKNKIKLK